MSQITGQVVVKVMAEEEVIVFSTCLEASEVGEEHSMVVVVVVDILEEVAEVTLKGAGVAVPTIQVLTKSILQE